MSLMRKIIMLAGGVLFGVWMATHWDRIAGDDDAVIRFTLGILFSVIIIFRSKKAEGVSIKLPRWTVLFSLAVGMIAVLGGMIFKINVLEWIGVLLLLFACAAWAAPEEYGADLILAFVILFWVHPIPGQVFGWLQVEMQRLSIRGAEFALQVVNTRVWGDMSSMVLRTGYHNFMIPEACSGMKTAVTVFLCTFGVGALLRLKWYEIILFIAIGLFQVLILNIARISFMVIWAPHMPDDWAETFLHDSLGIFLLVTILLVQLEASWWKIWSRKRSAIKASIKQRVIERPDKSSVVPHSLRRLIFILTIMVALGTIALGIASVIYKSRAYHRKEMIRDVAAGLMETDPAIADRAIKAALTLVPEDPELLSMQAHTDMICGRFKEGLAIFDAKLAAGETLTLEETVLKGWALMRLERIGEAKRIIDAIPPKEVDRRPGVAMLKAEFAAKSNNPAEAGEFVVKASVSNKMLNRVRGLFPYLAMHEQWKAIALSDRDQPYDEVYQALIAIRANQKEGDLAGVTRVMSQVVKVWPDDIRFLLDLYKLTLQDHGGKWEDLFEHNLLSNVGKMTINQLAVAQDYCWQIARPDLAWIVLSHLKQLDPNDPALLVSPAQYGAYWLYFRRHRINVKAENPTDRIDMLPMLNIFGECAPFKGVIKRIPLLSEARKSLDPKIRKQYLDLCIDELKKRESEGPLDDRLLKLYPMVLVMSGNFDEAHKRLDMMLKSHPEQAGPILFQHAVFYDQEGKFQQAYEALRLYKKMNVRPNLRAELTMVKACMNLNMGIYALDIIEKARITFPKSFRLDLAESAIWDVFGFKEQALHVISQIPGGSTSPVCVGLLYDTGRMNEARSLSEATGAPLPSYEFKQKLRLPSAEYSVARNWPPPLTKDEHTKAISSLESLIKKSKSPYFKSLFKLELNWHKHILSQTIGNKENHVEPNVNQEEVQKWLAVGRDEPEQVGALYRLAMLAAQQKMYKLAAAALIRCNDILPNSQVVLRALISVTEGDRSIVKDAYDKHPEDPEIMLAELVTKTRSMVDKYKKQVEESGTNGVHMSWEWATNMVSDVVESKKFSPGTLVRAGDFLLNNRQFDLAENLAKEAIANGRGLLAAYVLGLRTALMMHDLKWAEACAINGIENAQNPTPFYKTMVDIKASSSKIDNTLIDSLEYLQGQKGSDPRWSEMLGRVYFQKGDMQRSLSIFDSVMEGKTKTVNVRTLVLAAEAARRNSKTERAVSILESAYAMQPDDLSVLNNLVYLLAQNPVTLPRAQALMPKLLKIGSNSFAVMDTAAMVYLRGGDIENAKIWMDKATASINKDSYSAPEVELNAAELQMKLGNYKKARSDIDELRQNSGRNDYIDQQAQDLLRNIESISNGM